MVVLVLVHIGCIKILNEGIIMIKIIIWVVIILVVVIGVVDIALIIANNKLKNWRSEEDDE